MAIHFTPYTAKTMMPLTLLLAGPDCVHRYRHALLDAADHLRCQQQPALAQRIDWQSSRFLKQQRRRLAPNTLTTLSHSHGDAALLYGQQDALGVDLEQMRPRNFVALLPWCARDEEIQWWQQQPSPTLAFYRLWTLKEALIKAANLDFPADLRRTGLFRLPEGGWRIGIDHPQCHPCWHGFSHAVSTHMMLSCVWPQANAPQTLFWQGYGQTVWDLPPGTDNGVLLRRLPEDGAMPKQQNQQTRTDGC